MLVLILSLLFIESGATGLQRAGALIKEPLNSHKQINDIILTGITDSLEEKQLPITGAYTTKLSRICRAICGHCV